MEKQRLFKWNNKFYSKFYVIRNVDIHAGFTALMLYILNGIRKASELNAIPVIDLNKINTPNFYDINHGESIWEYFFKPISPYSIIDVQSFLKKGLINDSQIHFPTTKEVMSMHHEEKDRLATFWAKKTPLNKKDWIEKKRSLGRDYVREYIRVNHTITTIATDFVSSKFKDNYVIGIHIRGTDFAYASPTGIARYFEEIDRLIPKSKYLIFLATDQIQYVEKFKDRYKNKLLYTNALRSNNHIAPFRIDLNEGYKKGRDVLIDILILSKCNHVIKGAAAVGEMALWFNANDNVSDFSVDSEFYQKPYDKLEPAFLKFNIGRKKKLQLFFDRYRSRLVRKLQTTLIGRILYLRFEFIRKLLNH